MHFYNTTPLTLRKGDPQFPSIIYNSNSFLIRQGVRLGSASPPPDSRGPQLEYLIPEHFYWEEAEPSYHQLEARIAPTPATRPSRCLWLVHRHPLQQPRLERPLLSLSS